MAGKANHLNETEYWLVTCIKKNQPGIHERFENKWQQWYQSNILFILKNDFNTPTL